MVNGGVTSPAQTFALDLKANAALQNLYHSAPYNYTGTPPVAIEASPALGANGWLYVATRNFGDVKHNDTHFEVLVAIDPSGPTVKWIGQMNHSEDDADLGAIAAPVLDRAGFVYGTVFANDIEQFDALTGARYRFWTGGNLGGELIGKLCQTPSLTEDGLLLVAQSGTDLSGNAFPNVANIVALPTAGPLGANGSELWQIFADTADGLVPNFYGSPAVGASGKIYLADDLGRVLRIAGNTPLMESPWPTLAGGNARNGHPAAYVWQITELYGAYDIGGGPTPYINIASIDAAGRTLGNCYGTFASGASLGYVGTYWNPLSPQFATYNGSSGGYYSQNTTCEAGNSLGDIVGGSTTGGNALVWLTAGLPGTSVPYVTLPKVSGTTAYATAITEDRNVIGYTTSGSTVKVAQWYKNGTAWQRTDISGPAGNQAYAFACSISGMIVGKAKFETDTGAPFRAFRTEVAPTEIKTSHDLGTLADTSGQPDNTRSSEAWDVREDYGIVGRSQNGDGVWRAFYIPINGVITTASALPGLIAGTGGTWGSRADSLNRSGTLVGTAPTTSGGSYVSRAVQWTPNGSGGFAITDLNTVLPANSGWVVTSAIGINDNGFIIGWGTHNGNIRPYLLSPNRN